MILVEQNYKYQTTFYNSRKYILLLSTLKVFKDKMFIKKKTKKTICCTFLF